ncbi:shikimate dehydrogenase [Candidatus Venteria ishoeyi]|uniref:shikimate dehydrogenase n=1 Tax=Candidatus Venteria ishoeyi TaxID=1899563 RepID=UPI0025A5A8CC|nr:shikimate dehydrogenase [Candidatus Venteria ishoeyi]MDM8547950.1 shikimate dehydrogenase [Candidatus Venteria ishoeyi]
MKHADHYAVFGNPIKHSKSPRIHNLFAEQTRQNLIYEAILAQPDAFAAAIADFRTAGGRGCNVTVPFKEDAWQLAEQRSERAELAGAVNTLRFDESGLCFGDNTDGVGLVRDISENHGWQLSGKKILILGAGGAVRGVLAPLLDSAPATLSIANRTVSKAERLATLYPNADIQATGYEGLTGQCFDIIINGTSAGLQGKLPPLPDGLLAANGLAYDMVYANEPTVFVQWATAQGGHGVDGLGMLVEQAAESFYLWRGVRPETQAVIAELAKARIK